VPKKTSVAGQTSRELSMIKAGAAVEKERSYLQFSF
jgi:hypothetical protein